MIVRCPNEKCNAKMGISEEIVSNPKHITSCPLCKTSFKPYEIVQQVRKREKENRVIAGWLIIHDENAPEQTIDVYPGLNLFGRKYEGYQSSFQCDYYHPLETRDNTMSKEHFIVNVFKNKGNFHFTLKDADSKNGTFIDIKRIGEYEREVRKLISEEEIYIYDDAVIRAGRTHIHFKTKEQVQDREQATELFKDERFTKTVIV